MLFSRADVSDRETQRQFVVQFGVREERFPGRVDSMHDGFIQHIEALCPDRIRLAFSLRARAETD